MKKIKNNVAGTWEMVSADANPNTESTPILGPHPGGLLIFTQDFHFSVIVNNPNIPNFASGDRFQGTVEEKSLAVTNSLGLYGTYTVDENGDFFDQHVIGSTFPNWNNMDRGRDELRLTVKENRLIEQLHIDKDLLIEIVWQKVV